LPELALAQAAPPAAPGAPPPDESVLGPFVVTGHTEEHVTKLAVLPSLAPDLEDVILRSVVRRDLELSGMFALIEDSKAPAGMYGFDDPVDIDAWKKLGAEVIAKVAAQKRSGGKVEVYGLAYFLNVGKEPVYQKKLIVDAKDIRVTAHRMTDALLGAITGRPGGFASRFTFSGRWGKDRRVFTMDADGHDLKPVTDPTTTSIAPTWGPNQDLFYLNSKNYSPFRLLRLSDGPKPMQLPFKTSIYGVAFDKTFSKMAVAVAENARSAIYVGNPDGSAMRKVSTTELATHPVFSPSGKLAWLGGDSRQGSQRVYVDGKAASPSGFTASAPAFCDTEDGVRLVYAVAVGGDREDLVMSNEKGGGTSRLTQGQGSNAYPACSSDGRLLSFFSTRKGGPGLFMMSLKRFKTQKVTSQFGESLRWAPLGPAQGSAP
jgi:TolB protein